LVARTAIPDTTALKDRLRDYFNGVGFERWNAIYGQGELSSIRQSVREGHRTMLGHVEAWLQERALADNAQILDAGCGTGLFSVAMAGRGCDITAVDIAPQMVQAATERAQAADVAGQIDFVVGDLESVQGRYDAVVCLDVLIHYPRPAFDQLLAHLASLSRDTLIITYAPHNPALALMHYVGQFFPRSQRRTDIRMIREGDVHALIEQAGMQVQRSTRVSQGFYHVALLEARRMCR
jgi:magnesium-protoporphyrin O-methyltransferase